MEKEKIIDDKEIRALEILLEALKKKQAKSQQEKENEEKTKTEDKKKTKKVFSVDKYLDSCFERRVPEEIIILSLVSWALFCDGLTKEKLDQYGFKVMDCWLEEVEE